jgi:hypothetical protein
VRPEPVKFCPVKICVGNFRPVNGDRTIPQLFDENPTPELLMISAQVRILVGHVKRRFCSAVNKTYFFLRLRQSFINQMLSWNSE